MMEYWNDVKEKKTKSRLCQSSRRLRRLNPLKPNIPPFQYSIIPIVSEKIPGSWFVMSTVAGCGGGAGAVQQALDQHR